MILDKFFELTPAQRGEYLEATKTEGNTNMALIRVEHHISQPLLYLTHDTGAVVAMRWDGFNTRWTFDGLATNQFSDYQTQYDMEQLGIIFWIDPRGPITRAPDLGTRSRETSKPTPKDRVLIVYRDDTDCDRPTDYEWMEYAAMPDWVIAHPEYKVLTVSHGKELLVTTRVSIEVNEA